MFHLISRITNFPNLFPALDRVYILAQPTAERAHILVGLAGLVAEELLDEPLADAWELVEYIENGGIAMSETDAAMAQGFTVEDVEETMRLLSDHWPEVQQAAEWEISKMAPLSPQK